MRYGRAIKDSVLKRVLPPSSETIRSVSLDTGISEQTIRNWIEKVDKGILDSDVQLGPRQLGAAEKFNLLIVRRQMIRTTAIKFLSYRSSFIKQELYYPA